MGRVPPERQRKSDRRSAEPPSRENRIPPDRCVSHYCSHRTHPPPFPFPLPSPPAALFVPRLSRAEREAEREARGRRPQDVSSPPLPSGRAKARGEGWGDVDKLARGRNHSDQMEPQIATKEGGVGGGATAAAQPPVGRIPRAAGRSSETKN